MKRMSREGVEEKTLQRTNRLHKITNTKLCVYMRKNGLRHGKDKEIKIYKIS